MRDARVTDLEPQGGNTTTTQTEDHPQVETARRPHRYPRGNGPLIATALTATDTAQTVRHSAAMNHHPFVASVVLTLAACSS
jgi:hypothetical protein